jgi:hypothetical protein
MQTVVSIPQFGIAAAVSLLSWVTIIAVKRWVGFTT